MQIALAAVLVFAGVWFVALRPSSGASSASTPPPAPAPVAAKPAPGPSAPGEAGLRRAIGKAHGAAAASDRSAQALRNRSNGVNGPSATPTAPARGAAAVPAPVKPRAGARPVAGNRPGLHGVPGRVQWALGHHRVVALLFYNRHGSDDRAVKKAFAHLRHARGRVLIATAPISQLARVGVVTHVVSVFASPTVVVFDRTGQPTTLVGFADRTEIEQRIDDALAAGR